MSKINKLANPDFSQGKYAPRNWVWTGKPRGARWCRDAAEGIVVVSNRAEGSAYWSQVVVCKPGEFYRVEATATCELEASGDAGGLVLRVEALVNGRPRGEPCTTPGLHYADEPIAIRTYFKIPEGVRRVRVSAGVVDAIGTARIRQVRVIAILEPDEMSHVLAVPPPASAYARPKNTRTVCVCSDQGGDRPLTRLLSAFFGESKVRAIPRGEFRPVSVVSDALFLPDPVPPPAIRSLEQLVDLASDRMVVVSLPAFAKLTRGVASLRRVEQLDDPIHAKVTFANYATPGFALNDTFAYFVGVAAGKHKIWPRLSPKKSWEGTIGGWIAAGITGYVVVSLTPIPLSPWIGAIIGLVGGVLALFGDLTISMLKRQV
ncbi:MAG: phosphatidate cytidylyltransferase, partial [Planctomycetota bacterium]